MYTNRVQTLIVTIQLPPPPPTPYTQRGHAYPPLHTVTVTMTVTMTVDIPLSLSTYVNTLTVALGLVPCPLWSRPSAGSRQHVAGEHRCRPTVIGDRTNKNHWWRV